MYPSHPPDRGPGDRYPPMFHSNVSYNPYVHVEQTRPVVLDDNRMTAAMATSSVPAPQATTIQHPMVEQVLPAGAVMSSSKELLVMRIDKFTELVQSNGNVADLPCRPGTFIVAPGVNIGLHVTEHDIKLVYFLACPPSSLRIDHDVLQSADFDDDHIILLNFQQHVPVPVQPVYTTPSRTVRFDMDSPNIANMSSAFISRVPSEAHRHALNNATAENIVLRAQNADLTREIAAAKSLNTCPVAHVPTMQNVGEQSAPHPAPSGELPTLQAAYTSLMAALQQLSSPASTPLGLPTHVTSHVNIPDPNITPTKPLPCTVQAHAPLPVSPHMPSVPLVPSVPLAFSAASARKEWKVLHSMDKFLHKPGSTSYTSTQFKDWLHVTLELGMKHFFCMSMHSPADSLPAGWAEYLGHLMDPQFFKTHILPVASTLTMASFKTIALRAYAPSIRSEADIARQKIISGTITQGYHSVAVYISTFTEQMLLIPDMAEADRMAYFRRGLKSNIREQCIANFRVHPPREFADLVDLQQHAAWIELDLNERTHDQLSKHYTPSRAHSYQRRSHVVSHPVVAPVMGTDHHNRVRSRSRNPPSRPESQNKRAHISASGSMGGQPAQSRVDPKLEMMKANPSFVSTAPYEHGRRYSVLYVCRKKSICPRCLEDYHGNWGTVQCTRKEDPADHYMSVFNKLIGTSGTASEASPMHTN